MQRAIAGYRRDEENHWVAILDCGHARHVRHQPPLVSRPWVLSEAGRNSRLGLKLNCVRCDNFEVPVDFVAYECTPVFTAATMPGVLREDHAMRRGVWGRVHVLEGKLRYQVPALAMDIALDAGSGRGVIIPEVVHSIEPLEGVRFFVELYRSKYDL